MLGCRGPAPAHRRHFPRGTVQTSLCVHFGRTQKNLSAVRFPVLDRSSLNRGAVGLGSIDRGRTASGNHSLSGGQLARRPSSKSPRAAATSKGPAHPLPGERGGCGALSGFRSTVRFSLPPATERLDELLRVVRFQQEHQQPVGGAVPKPDQLPPVVDRHDLPEDGQSSGLLFELQRERLFDLRKRLSVRFRDPHRVVVQLAGDARLLRRSVNKAEFAVGIEERLLAFRQFRGHDVVRGRMGSVSPHSAREHRAKSDPFMPVSRSSAGVETAMSDESAPPPELWPQSDQP